MLKNSKLIYKPDGMPNYEWRQAWLSLRVGRFTASKIYKLVGATKKKDSIDWKLNTTQTRGLQTWENYTLDIVEELIEGRSEEMQTDDMMNGNAFEMDALEIFEQRNQKFLRTLTFLEVGEHCGISSDGLDFDNNFGVEVKSPHLKTFEKYNKLVKQGCQLEFAKACPDHYGQMQMAMWGFEFEYYYFVAYYSPAYQKHGKKEAKYIQMLIKRDDAYINAMSDCIDIATEFKNARLAEYYTK